MRAYFVALRENVGLSQRKVALMSGISYQHYSKLENGERGPKMSFMIAGRLAEVFGVTLDYLYKEEVKYQNE